MDTKTTVFKGINCDEAKCLIEQCAKKKTDRITWGRLLKHLRKCFFCRQLFYLYHRVQIDRYADQVIDREMLSEHRFYSIAEEVSMHFPKVIMEMYLNSQSDLTDDEKTLIAEHIISCLECKSLG